MKLSIVFRASPWLDRTILRKKFWTDTRPCTCTLCSEKNSHLCCLA